MGSKRDNEARNTNFEYQEDDSASTVPRFDRQGSSSGLTRSESLPVLKNTSSTEVTNEERLPLTSESSLARQRKMKMIVTRMGSLLSSMSDATIVSTDTSKADLTDENYEAKKLESKTELPVLQDTINDPSSETINHEKSRSSERAKPSSSGTAEKVTETPKNSQEDGDLIDIAENPHPSIRSFYFPPNPQEKGPSTHSSIQSRVAKDLDALQRIDGELGPLQHKLNEITGKFRAMNLAVPSLLSQEHYSTRGLSQNMSGYYLHRTETFGRDSNVNSVVHLLPRTPAFTRNLNNLIDRSFSKSTNENVNSNVVVNEKDSCLTLRNSVQLDHFGKNPSGSLIPCVSSSCYKCFRRRSDYQSPQVSYYFDELETGVPNRSIDRGSSELNFVKSKKLDEPRYVSEALCAPSTSTEAHCSGRIVGGGNSSILEENNSKLIRRNDGTREKSTLTSQPRNSKTRYVNYTRVNSQTSLIISKKDQSIETMDLGRSKSDETKKKKIRDVDVQCSGYNLTYQKEIVLRRSMESLLRPSGSEDSNVSNSNFEKTKSLKIPDRDDKVIVVPIFFVDGVPEPPKIPLFKFIKSKCYLPKTKHRVVKLEERTSSLTQSSLLSDTSIESLAMETYLGQKFMNSRMSVSCVSRNTSHSKTSQTNTVKSLEHYRRSKSRRAASMVSESTRASKSCSESTKKGTKMIMRGMRSSPEDFLCDT